MAYRIKITDPAKSDIKAAVQRLNEEAPMHARKWYQGLREAIQTLSEMPSRCPLAPEAKKTKRGIRHLLYGKRTGLYRIIFDIEQRSEEGPRVRVLRVWHSSRDRLNVKDLEAEKAPNHVKASTHQPRIRSKGRGDRDDR